MANKFIIKGIRKFNEQKVIEKTLILLSRGDDSEVKRRYNEPTCGELESYTLMIEGLSTQGITIKQMIGGCVIVELPWLASEADVRLCYACLNAIKKTHRASRITDEDEKDAKLSDIDALEAWHQRSHNMEQLLRRGEIVVITGVTRDFHLDPSKYYSEGMMDAFNDFTTLQWTNLDAVNVREEKRHITDDEELSTVRVVDNTENVFIGACRYVGMMRGNTCKMIVFEDFCELMKGHEEFRRMDAAQVLLDKMDEDVWNNLFDEVQGIIRENFRKTFIMRWNTDISNYKLSEFEEALNDFEDEGFYYDWSIWDYQKAHVGDRFYMIRTGEGKEGVVMRGTIIGTPYPDEDWSGRGRKVYYIRMSLSHMIHPEKTPLLLTVEDLNKGVPGFNWNNGHSGEILNDEQASQLEEVWHSYVEHVHQIATHDEIDGKDLNSAHKEKGWKAIEINQSQGSHLETVIDLDNLPAILQQIGQWPLYGSSYTSVTSDDYNNEEGDVIAVRTGEDLGLMSLLLNNEKKQIFDFLTLYPCHKGTKHMMIIKKVFEWDNQVEAIVWAESENLSLAFFATDYYLNKEKYAIGATLNIELAASAYKIEEGDREVSVDGDAAAMYRETMNIDKEYDEDGNLLPVTFICDNLVAYLDHDESCPDDAEFISPIEECEDFVFMGKKFVKATISISHEPEEMFVPLYFKKEMLNNIEKGMPVRGYLWMQGQISD